MSTRIEQNSQPRIQDSAIGSLAESATLEAASGRATPIRTLDVLILGGLSALGPLSTDMYLPALPAISRDLGATMAQTQITLSAGILGLALGQVLAGPSSDMLGRRRPLLGGVAAFVLASLLCTTADSFAALAVLRFMQGIAGAAGIAIALAVVSDRYTGVVQARFFALLMQVSGLAPIVAPIIGSQLLGFTSWRGLFVTLALFGLLLLVAVGFGLPETLPPSQRQVGGISALLRAFRTLLTDRRFIGHALASGLAFAAGIIYISMSPFVLQNIYGVGAQQLGIILGINAFGIVIMAQVSARLVGRISPRKLLGWGVAALALGGVALLAVVVNGIGLIGMLPALFVVIASLGLIAPNATTLALAGTPTAGSASALLGVLQFTIGAVAAPIVGTAGTTTAIPMTAGIAAFGLATLLTFWIFCQPNAR